MRCKAMQQDNEISPKEFYRLHPDKTSRIKFVKFLHGATREIMPDPCKKCNTPNPECTVTISEAYASRIPHRLYRITCKKCGFSVASDMSPEHVINKWNIYKEE